MKFQESYNFPGNKNFERVLLDLLNIKPDCSYENYVVYHFFCKALNMQNIPPFEEVFNKSKHKNTAGSALVNFAAAVNSCSFHYISGQ